MLTILKEFSKLKIYIFIILETNFIYAIAHIGNMLIEGHYSFATNLLAYISSLYSLFLLFIGYTIYSFLDKQVTSNLTRVYFDDSGAFKLLAD